HVPKKHELAKYQTTESHLKIGPPSIPRLEGQQVNVTELFDFLKAADRERLIPDILRESTSDTSTVTHRKQQILQELSALMQQLQRGVGLSDRLIKVRDVLSVYTVQVKERLKQATSQQAKREIYNELVELVGKGMGFACSHCEDHKLNAAMQIFNEKIVGNLEESGTTKQKILEWLAKKRDALVSGMLQEMVQEHMNSGFMGRVFSDVSSSISRWRYVCRRPLGLGDVPSPAHSIDSGLTESQILARFKRTYTVNWILEQAMEEYKKGAAGHKELQSGPMADYLASRISNFQDLMDDLLKEDGLTLRKEAMALYLQEIGVFTAIV
ncbi:MAG: hypothetical protein JSR46_07760, partial [Verrucomicrobia bacterium]|nr:hypothetical protein [Verrucomicrobiota bacterium]